MQVFKKTGGGLLTAGIFFLLFLLVFEDKIHLPPWLQVAGRMHPMFLHFPITLLLVYFVVFWIPAAESSTSWVRVIGFVAALSALVTAIMGLMLSMQESFEGGTFQRHKWGGVGIALIALLFYYLQPYFIKTKIIAKPLTLVATVLILLTGHWGGNLTHGEGYLLQPYAKEKKPVLFSQAIAFSDIVQPVLETKCGSCHSNGNSKGGLSVADTAGVLEGGKTGPFFVSGHPEKSLFIQRVLLPLSDKKHMAPASKPQLTDEELQLLTSWVRSGAPMNKKVADLPAEDSFRLVAAKSLAPADNTEEVTYNFPAADEKTIRSLNNNYRVVVPRGRQSAALDVQFYGSRMYTPKALEELLAVKQQITDLNLSKMPVKNDELKIIEQMPNLERLNLNYTDITDAGLPHLIKLKNLKEITLSGTPVTASGLGQLLKIPSLNTAFVWNTAIDSNNVRALRLQHKNVSIQTGYVDQGEDILPLNPPVVETASGVYDRGLHVSVKHPLKGVEIRYTLNGAEPDSVHSAIYKAPFTLDTFTVIKAKAYKPKWYGSKTLKAVYFMKGVKPDSVLIVSEEKDNLGKGKQLFDLETGDLNTGSGKWIGLKKPMTCYVFFNEPVEVRNVTLNMFINTGDNMLLPEKMELWGGMDKDHTKLLKSWTGEKPPAEEKPAKEKKPAADGKPSKETGPDIVQPSIAFQKTGVKCIKLVMKPWEIKKKDIQSFVSEIVIR